jgi:uncharacterized protein RhaS with RHS repeats
VVSETGLAPMGWRYYDPAAGRFLTRDPIGYNGGANLYGYCDGDPVNWADPWGLLKKQSKPMKQPCRMSVLDAWNSTGGRVIRAASVYDMRVRSINSTISEAVKITKVVTWCSDVVNLTNTVYRDRDEVTKDDDPRNDPDAQHIDDEETVCERKIRKNLRPTPKRAEDGLDLVLKMLMPESAGTFPAALWAWQRALREHPKGITG